MSKRNLAMLFLVVALATAIAPAAVAQCTSSGANAAYWHNDINANLNDYALIWRDARNPACAATAAAKLNQKLDVTAGRWRGVFMGWLLAYALASGLELGGLDENNPSNPALLTATLDIKLRDAALLYDRVMDPTCGFPANWRNGNNCMDDYTMATAAFGWKAAYLRLTGRDWRASRTMTINNSKSALTSTATPPYDSVCIRSKDQNKSYEWNWPWRGYCNGTLAELANGTADVISMNHGNQTPAYGLALITGLEVGFNGLDTAEAPANGRYDWTAENRLVAEKLFAEGQAKTTLPGAWKNECHDIDANGYLLYPPSLPCGDEHGRTGIGYTGPFGQTQVPYQPKMFPVVSFLYQHGVNVPTSGGYAWNTFDASLFDANNYAIFFGPARLEGYNKFANGWDHWSERGLLTGRPEYKMSVKGGAYFFQPMGGVLYDTATTNSATTKFILRDLQQGVSIYLYNSDKVTLKHEATGYYMVAENGGGGAVNVNRVSAGPWETFTMIRLGPSDPYSGIIAHGDTFALKASTGHYVSFVPNGTVTASATTVGTYETLTFTRTD